MSEDNTWIAEPNLEVLGDEFPKFFPARSFFHVFRMKGFTEVTLFQKTSPALKNSWLRPWKWNRGTFRWKVPNASL